MTLLGMPPVNLHILMTLPRMPPEILHMLSILHILLLTNVCYASFILWRTKHGVGSLWCTNHSVGHTNRHFLFCKFTQKPGY